ncbi:hypothetical protein IWW37_003644 [Coemansia sp. RSA 2050]|nr:hypothetical protein IWW37_003644 [Coemansia sp. RSA 2050]KAJ2732757.1 hypothetical protein IW152_003560 [Coemansia sp. BCRC 34962]
MSWSPLLQLLCCHHLHRQTHTSSPLLFARALGSQRSRRSKSTIVTAWGSYWGSFAEPRTDAACTPSISAGSNQPEANALLVPTRLSLDKLAGPAVLPKNARISAMGAGARHALIAFSTCEHPYKTKLLGLGLNRCRQLGRAASNAAVTPVVTAISGKVSQIACGREHSALLVEMPDGSVRILVCGSNAFGQIGLATPPRHDLDPPKLSAFAVSDLTSLDDLMAPGESPTKLQCGLDHTVVLTSSGRAFAMGWGADGQLGAGLKLTTACSCPALVSGLERVPLRDISSSTDFTLGLTADNRLYYWGNAEYGQCMTGTKIDQVLAPIQAPFGFGRITGIAAGGCHALVLTDEGRVYSCGYGALGLGPTTIATLQPTLIEGLHDIQAIFASTDRCLAIDSRHRVYSWGLGNIAGRLGNGTVGVNAYEPEVLSACLPAADAPMIALGNDMALIAAIED